MLDTDRAVLFIVTHPPPPPPPQPTLWVKLYTNPDTMLPPPQPTTQKNKNGGKLFLEYVNGTQTL